MSIQPVGQILLAMKKSNEKWSDRSRILSRKIIFNKYSYDIYARHCCLLGYTPINLILILKTSTCKEGITTFSKEETKMESN
jgi:hypothetical protein